MRIDWGLGGENLESRWEGKRACSRSFPCRRVILIQASAVVDVLQSDVPQPLSRASPPNPPSSVPINLQPSTLWISNFQAKIVPFLRSSTAPNPAQLRPTPRHGTRTMPSRPRLLLCSEGAVEIGPLRSETLSHSNPRSSARASPRR